MRYNSLAEFLRQGARHLAHGPVALIFFEDGAEADGTLLHHLRLGFGRIAAFMPEGLDLPFPQPEAVAQVRLQTRAPEAVRDAVNGVIAAAPGQWFYSGYNAEYLFYPFCETRSVGELLAFHTEERRESMPATVVDLYAANLAQHPDAVDPASAHFDRTGYFDDARCDVNGAELERQRNIFGGLRWRLEEHVPPQGRRLDRIALFRSKPGLQLRPDNTFSDEEYNTISCPWHHNLTAGIASFRAAKALRANPASRDEIHTFLWPGAERFDWNSQQLLDLGFMEPGQWF